MTVSATGSNCNIDYTKWVGRSTSTTSSATAASITENSSEDVLSLSHTSGCTDGKDDGKIGFFSAVGNAIKGVAKTAVNAVKSCVTDSEGNFSLGKTLMTAATVGLCIAVPAVGLAACAVGGVMGAIQVGKGIYNAATAETDAEAKSAWQNIGGGAFTVGMSVAGGKASLNAVKSASTAGANGASALDSLSENATLGQKASALAQDCISSTKNNVSSIISKVGNMVEAVKIKSLQNKVSNIEGGITESEQSLINELNAREAWMSDGVESQLNNLDDISSTVSSAASAIKSKLQNPGSTIKDLGSSAVEAVKTVGSNSLSAIKNAIKNPSVIKTAASNLSSKGQQVLNAIKSTDTSYAELVQQYGYESVAEVIAAVTGTKVASDSV